MSVPQATTGETTAPAPPGFWHRAVRHKSFMIGGALSFILVMMAAVSLVWTPHSETAIDVKAKLKTPGWEHLLGTDFLGRDIFSMIMVGAQNSIMVGVIAVSIGVVGGILVGLSASAQRGLARQIDVDVGVEHG